MTDPTSSPLYAEAIRARRRSPREVVTWLLILAALVVFGVFSTARDVSTATTSYEEVTVTATGEFQSGERVRTRRRVSTREVRHVEVSMPDGSLVTPRSAGLSVWLQPATTAMREMPRKRRMVIPNTILCTPAIRPRPRRPSLSELF